MSSNAPATAREPRQRAEPGPVAGAWDARPCVKAPSPGGEGQGSRPHDHASPRRARRVAATRAGSGTGSRRAPAHVTESMRRRADESFRPLQVSDVFLGWYSGGDGRHYYWRQLRDMKGSALIETM